MCDSSLPWPWKYSEMPNYVKFFGSCSLFWNNVCVLNDVCQIFPSFFVYSWSCLSPFPSLNYMILSNAKLSRFFYNLLQSIFLLWPIFIVLVHSLLFGITSTSLNCWKKFLAQIVTYYKHDQLTEVLDVCERMHAHLTAAVVSNDPLFLQVQFATVSIN